MFQLQIPNIEEDIIASCIRRQKNLYEKLIQELEQKNISRNLTIEKIREIETGIKRLCQAA